MMAARAVYPKRFKVCLGAISLMFRKAEFRELTVDFPHDPVAGHLGDDAGRRDRERTAVAFDDGIVRKRETGDWQSIDQAMVGAAGEGVDGAAHGQVGGPQDIELVDFEVIRRGHGPEDLGISRELFIHSITIQGAGFF